MMRDILFRGKAISNGEWVYGDLLQSDYSDGLGIRGPATIRLFGRAEIPLYHGDDMNGGNTAGWNAQVDPHTVGQYTGLKDRNGTRIFEGDILNDGFGYLRVVWDGGAFGMSAGRKHFTLLRPEKDFERRFLDEIVEVVGNAYDNPELMGGGGTP